MTSMTLTYGVILLLICIPIIVYYSSQVFQQLQRILEQIIRIIELYVSILIYINLIFVLICSAIFIFIVCCYVVFFAIKFLRNILKQNRDRNQFQRLSSEQIRDIKDQNMRIKMNYQKLICPISLKLLSEPVLLRCGHCFEKVNIVNVLRLKQQCPMCKNPNPQNDIFPNIPLTYIIEEFKTSVRNKGQKWAQQELEIQSFQQQFGDYKKKQEKA